MKGNKKVFNLNLIVIIATFIGLVLLWTIGAYAINESLIMPRPLEVCRSIGKLFVTGEFWLSLLSTLGRTFIAFGISFVLGFVLAIIIKFSKVGDVIIKIIIAIIRAMPTIAVILLLLLWTNSKIASIVVTILVVLPIVFASVSDSFDRIDPKIVQMCNFYNVSKEVQMRKYIIPQIWPNMIDIIGRTFSLNLKLMVASEVLAGVAVSIGNLMSKSKIYFETAQLFALVILSIGISVCIELSFAKISKGIRGKFGIKKHNKKL